MPTPVPGDESVAVVDTHLLGSPDLMSAYVVDAADPAVIDPGPATATDRLLDALADLGIDPAEVAYVLPTHAHLDHAGAAGGLAAACENATVLCHEAAIDYLTDTEKLERLVASAERAMGDVATGYGDPDPLPAERCEAVAGGERIDLGSRTLELLDAPGHAPHQYSPFDPDAGTLFAADAAGMHLFDTLLPATPAPDFDLAASLATLDRLAARDPERVCLGHFGVAPDPGILGRYRSLLSEWVEAVRVARADHGDDVTAVSNALRAEWPSPMLDRAVQGVLTALRNGSAQRQEQ